MSDFDRIEFRTLDRTLLRGNFFRAAEEKAPVVIMTQGLTLLKEHYIAPDAACPRSVFGAPQSFGLCTNNCTDSLMQVKSCRYASRASREDHSRWTSTLVTIQRLDRSERRFPRLILTQLDLVRRLAAKPSCLFEPGALLFGVGTGTVPTFFLLDGSVTLFGVDGLERQSTLRELEPGHFIGALNQLADRPSHRCDRGSGGLQCDPAFGRRATGPDRLYRIVRGPSLRRIFASD